MLTACVVSSLEKDDRSAGRTMGVTRKFSGGERRSQFCGGNEGYHRTRKC